MPRTTLILSDTHLGRPGPTTATSLRPLWQGVDELVINGDCAEVQIPWLRSAALREVDRLQDLTRRDGVRLHLVSGNHDAYLSDTRHLALADGRVLAMHGDALTPESAPWTRSAKAMRRLSERAFAQLTPDQHDCLTTRLKIAQHVGHSEFLEEYVLSSRGESGLIRAAMRPWEVAKVLAYWRREPGLAACFVERYAPQARCVVLGHSHHAALNRRGGRIIINTGAFTFPGRPWCVVVSGTSVCVQRIAKTDAGYTRAKPVAEYDLDTYA